jgi:hypothetical protein
VDLLPSGRHASDADQDPSIVEELGDWDAPPLHERHRAREARRDRERYDAMMGEPPVGPSYPPPIDTFAEAVAGEGGPRRDARAAAPNGPHCVHGPDGMVATYAPADEIIHVDDTDEELERKARATGRSLEELQAIRSTLAPRG